LTLKQMLIFTRPSSRPHEDEGLALSPTQIGDRVGRKEYVIKPRWTKFCGNIFTRHAGWRI